MIRIRTGVHRSRCAGWTGPVQVRVSLGLTDVLTSRQRLRQGVVRDLERLERKEQNLRLLEEQRVLTRHLEGERRRREAQPRPQDT